MGMLQTPAACLGMFIQIIVLDLAEIPVISVDDPAEHLRTAMIGKTDLPDGATGLLFCDPFSDAHIHKALPGIRIVEHMHQIVVHIVSAQPLQFLLEEAFNAGNAFDQVVGQLGGDVNILADAVSLKDLTNGGFTVQIDIGSVIVVDTVFVGSHDLPLCFVDINGAGFALEAHTAKAQNRQFVSVFVGTVLHGNTSFSSDKRMVA